MLGTRVDNWLFHNVYDIEVYIISHVILTFWIGSDLINLLINSMTDV